MQSENFGGDCLSANLPTKQSHGLSKLSLYTTCGEGSFFPGVWAWQTCLLLLASLASAWAALCHSTSKRGSANQRSEDTQVILAVSYL